MRFKFFIYLILIISLFSFAAGEEIKLNDNFYISGNNPKSMETKEIRELGIEIIYQSSIATAAKLDSKIVLILVDSFEDKKMAEWGKSHFIDLKLDKEGVPLLNLLVAYSLKEKEIKIIYAKGCVYEKVKLDELAKTTADEMKKSVDYKPLLKMREEMNSISQLKFKEFRNNPVKYCPISETSQYKIDKTMQEGCSAFFQEDKFESNRLKVLVLGNNFSSESEFKQAIDNYVLREGFMKIEPFKTYTKNGKDGLFFFVYGKYDLGIDLGTGSDVFENSQSVQSSISDQISRCSNVFYAIVLNKNKDKFRSFYYPNLKTTFSEIRSSAIIHETGHRFKLSDEYSGFDAINALFNTMSNEFQSLCSKSPENDWKDILGKLGEYKFKTCSGSDDLYRSSYESIMRNTYVYEKFNFLSCLLLVREFERETKVTDKIITICNKLYESGGLQKPTEISIKDVYYKYCLELSDNSKGINCNEILIKCSKTESMENPMEVCILGEIK